jgi:predicted DNA binding protein
MRRLIIEYSLNDISPEGAVYKLKSFEIVNILRLEPGEFSALVRVNFGQSQTRIEDIFLSTRHVKVEHELLEVDGETYTYFFRVKARPGHQRRVQLSSLTSGGYLSTPLEVKNGKLKATFLGNAGQLKNILKTLDKRKTKYKVVSLADARVSPNSPLLRLTEKQREVLTKAYEFGYYDRPRRIGSDQLAQKLDLSKSTFVAHRRKAEKRLLAEVLSEAY